MSILFCQGYCILTTIGCSMICETWYKDTERIDLIVDRDTIL